MDNFEPKKLLILRILEILTEYSDGNHKLRQVDIISLLKHLYGIECERKAVARNIDFWFKRATKSLQTKTATILLKESMRWANCACL